MEEYAVEIRETASTALFLLSGQLGSAITNAVASILVIRYLAPEEYGLLGVAFILPGIFATFRDWGVPTATAKFVAELRGKKRTKLKSVVNTAILIELVASLILFGIAFWSADFFSSLLLKKPVTFLSRVALALLIIEAIQLVCNNVLLGQQRTEFIGISKVLKGVTRIVCVTYFIIFLRLQALGALMAYIAAMIVATVVVFMAVKRKVLCRFSEDDKQEVLNINLAKDLYSYGIPLQMGKFLSQGFNTYYFSLFAIFATALEIGYFRAAQHVIGIVSTYLVLPLSLAFFATFSKRSTNTANGVLKLSLKFNFILLIAAFTGMFTLSEPLVYVVLTSSYEPAIFMIRLLSLTILIQAFGGPILGSYLQGMGDTKTIFKADAVCSVIGIAISTLLIPSYGPLGVILTLVSTSFAALGFYLWYFAVKKQYTFTYPRYDIAKVLLTTVVVVVISSAITYLPILHLFKLILGIGAIAVGYLAMLPLVGGIRRGEIQYIRVGFGSWKGIRIIVCPLLDFMDRLARN